MAGGGGGVSERHIWHAFLWQKAPQAEDSNCEQLKTHHLQPYNPTVEQTAGT